MTTVLLALILLMMVGIAIMQAMLLRRDSRRPVRQVVKVTTIPRHIRADDSTKPLPMATTPSGTPLPPTALKPAFVSNTMPLPTVRDPLGPPWGNSSPIGDDLTQEMDFAWRHTAR